MKKAVILHGTDGAPEHNWFPWLKNLLEANGVETWVPLLPDNDSPNRFKYETFLRDSGWDFTDNLLIGHSSGATTVLNLMQSDWFPRVDTAVTVATFLNERLLEAAKWYTTGQFDQLFPESFDIKLIKSKTSKFYLLHGNDDPFCDIKDAQRLCDQLNGSFIEVVGGLHLGINRKELPEILPVLKERGYL